MNQTRILLGVCLALGAAVALLFYQQQKQTQQLLQVVAGKTEPAAPAPAKPVSPTPAALPAAPAGSPVAPPAAPAATDTAAADAAAADAAAAAAAAEKERLAAMERELKASQAEIAALKGENTELYDEAQRLRLEVDARLGVIRQAPMLAKVTAVVPDQRIVVIGAGSANNIAAGEEFSVRRDSRIVARIKVSDSVEANEAAAEILPGTLVNGEQVKEGDDVVKLD